MAFLFPDDAGEGKTERGSEKKREDARKEGKVVQSPEVITIAVMSFAMFAFFLSLPMLRHYLTGLVLQWSQLDVRGEWSVDFVQALLEEALIVFALGVFPIGLAAVLASTIASFAQTNLFFKTEVLKPNFKGLNPVSGAKQLFSKESIIKLGLSLLKVIVITLVVWGVLHKQLTELVVLHRLTIVDGIQWFMSVFTKIVWRVLALFSVVAVLDWIKEKRKYEKSIMMTKQEVKDEQKGQESSQMVKQQMRKKMRDLSMSRMMAAVPDATVVITNPTYIAIAIKYDKAVSDAPIVVAKGKRLTAARIRQIAEDSGVSVIERKPLARAMYSQIEVGKAVPPGYYKAISELLAYLYRMGDTRVKEQLSKR
jgi:flagellar biosynthesis protein FlhB